MVRLCGADALASYGVVPSNRAEIEWLPAGSMRVRAASPSTFKTAFASTAGPVHAGYRALQKSTIPGATAVLPEVTLAGRVTAVPASAVAAENGSAVVVLLPLAEKGVNLGGAARTGCATGSRGRARCRNGESCPTKDRPGRKLEPTKS